MSDETLRRLHAAPEQIEALLSDFEDEEQEADRPLTDEGIETSLDKAWHAIHYLLTGTAWDGRGPEAFLLLGGQPIGDIDVGYGPARGISAAETRQIGAMLERAPREALAARFDGGKLDAAKIYPEIWARDGQDGLDYVLEFYDALRDFVATAVRKGMGMMIYVT